MSSNTKNRNQRSQQQTNTTPKIKETPAPEDENVSRFKELLPQFKQATSEEIKEILRDFNNNMEAAVNAALNGTLNVKPPSAWEKVGQVKKKKKTNTTTQKPQRYNQKYTKTESDDSKGGKGANTSRESNYKSDNRQQGRGRVGDQIKTPQNKQQLATKTPAPSGPSTATVPAQQPTLVAPPSTAISPPIEPPVNQPTSTPTPQPVPTSTITPATSNTKLSYANVAKSRKPWKPTTSTGSQATSESPQLNESREEPPSTAAPIVETPVIVSPSPVSPPSQIPSQPIVQPEPEIETPIREVPQPAPTIVSPPQQSAQSTHTQQLVQPQVSQPQAQQVPQQSQQEKAPRGVHLPGSFGNDDSMQFQFGNLGINYDEELIHSDNLSHVSELKNSAPKHAQKLVNEPINMVMPGDLDPELQHAPLYQPYMVQFHGYDPASEPGAPRGSPMGHYYDTQFQYRDSGKYRGSNQSYGQRDNTNAKFGSPDATSVNPAGSSSTQAGAQAAPYPFSHPVFYPGMVLPQAYASAYQSSQFNYGYPFSKYPNFGNFQPGSNMYTTEEDFKGGVYRGVPQQSGMYFPSEQISREGKAQASTGSQSNPKQQSAGQGNKGQNFSGAQQEASAPSNASGNFKNSQQNSEAFYGREFTAMGGNSFLGQYPPYLPQTAQMIQGQPTGAPYQGPRNNNY